LHISLVHTSQERIVTFSLPNGVVLHLELFESLLVVLLIWQPLLMAFVVLSLSEKYFINRYVKNSHSTNTNVVYDFRALWNTIKVCSATVTTCFSWRPFGSVFPTCNVIASVTAECLVRFRF